MSGKHRKNADDQIPATAAPVVTNPAVKRARAPRSHTATVLTSASIAVAFAGFAAAVLVSATDDTSPQQSIAPIPAAAEVASPRPVQQEGVIVAVTADTITARSADGFVQTYRVTPNTTAVTQDGGDTFTAAVPFAVNDEVAIQATVSSGTATATAVADRAVIGADGPPMDYV